MALTESQSLELWTLAPAFTLLNVVNQRRMCLNEIQWRNGTIIIFMCNHCPYVIHVKELIWKLYKEFITKGVGFAAISSNDAIAYPDDGPEKMAAFANNNEYTFPYFYDESQEVAKEYGAVCTPEIFYFWKRDELIYHGQLDDSRPGNDIEPSWDDLRAAIYLYLEKWEALATQKPSIGCSIKWK